MSILYLLIPLAVIIMAVAVGFFLWTIKSGQYEDMDGPAYRILMDDDDPMIPRQDWEKPDKSAQKDAGSGPKKGEQGESEP